MHYVMIHNALAEKKVIVVILKKDFYLQDHLLTNGKSTPEFETPKDEVTVRDAVAQYLSFSGWLPKTSD